MLANLLAYELSLVPGFANGSDATFHSWLPLFVGPTNLLSLTNGASDPKPPDASVRYEEAITYNIAPCPLRARRVRPALTEVGSS